jgi:two-component system chemotaxis response regulator CheB
MRRIKILIVDDAVVVRQMVARVLAEDPAIEVIGTAANGRIALSKVKAQAPDLITLDVDMPEMDGLEMLVELRKLAPQVQVIMFSSLTEAGAKATLDALALGAADYVPKPSSPSTAAEAMARVREELLPRIKALGAALDLIGAENAEGCGAARRPAPRPAGQGQAQGAVRRGQRVELLCVGASTGGPNALAEVLRGLPGELPVPVLVVQHMPPLFTRLLAERLNRGGVPVHEAEQGDALEPGHVYLAPGNYHMGLGRSGSSLRVQLNQGPPENSCRPAVDVLFRSAAEHQGAHVLGVVLTGMGQDGLRGAQRISEAGGQIFVQDEATSVVWGMPGAVASAGLADRVLPLHLMAGAIVRRIAEGRSWTHVGGV